MKKNLILLPLILLATGCAKEPAIELPSISSNYSESIYSVKLTADNCGLPSDYSESTEIVKPEIETEEDKNVKYTFEMGVPCYLTTKAHEFIVGVGSYVKSSSEYKVDRIIVDFFGKKGIHFGVYSNSDGSGEALEYHQSSIPPEDPSDGGIVYEYSVNSTSWCLKNVTEFNKPGIYSITVIFSK